MLDLNNVDLIAISSDKVDETIYAIQKTIKNINFNEVKFLTHVNKQDYEDKYDLRGINFIKIDEIKSHKQYNDFCLSLRNYSDSDFIMLIQNDGFVTEYRNWTEDFLKFDYIGAPWTVEQQKKWRIPNRVGNGGFCIRSKRFLDFSAKYESCGGMNEDGFLVNVKIKDALNYGIKFPSVYLAKFFSVETLNPWETFAPQNSFGFHGKHLLEEAKKYIS